MEEDEEGQRIRKELAKQEFARRKASFSKPNKHLDKVALTTERQPSLKRLAHQTTQNIDKCSDKKTGRRPTRGRDGHGVSQWDYQASYMPSVGGVKKGPPSFMVDQNNEDIINLLKPGGK